MTTKPYPLSLHDALPIWGRAVMPTATYQPTVTRGAVTAGSTADEVAAARPLCRVVGADLPVPIVAGGTRSEEHTSELQSRRDLVCRLLLEKKKTRPAATSSGLSTTSRARQTRTTTPTAS